jgi:DNA polymerase III psi subunit
MTTFPFSSQNPYSSPDRQGLNSFWQNPFNTKRNKKGITSRKDGKNMVQNYKSSGTGIPDTVLAFYPHQYCRKPDVFTLKSGGFCILAPSIMNVAESQLLFSEEPLIQAPVIRAVVGIPLSEMPTVEEYDLLTKILKALTLKHGMYRFVFYAGDPEDLQMAEDDVLVLVFLPAHSGVIKVESVKRDGSNWVKVPSLSQIALNAELKREVWNALKPFSIR